MVEGGDVSAGRHGAERDDGAVAPHLGADRLSGKDRAGKPHLDRPEPFGFQVAVGSEKHPDRDPERAKAVKDRPVESGRRGNRRVLSKNSETATHTAMWPSSTSISAAPKIPL